MKGILKKIKPTAVNPPPKDGWRNLYQIIQEDGEGLSETRVRELLNVGVRQGVVERQKFRIEFNGNIRPIWHYREKK